MAEAVQARDMDEDLQQDFTLFEAEKVITQGEVTAKPSEGLQQQTTQEMTIAEQIKKDEENGEKAEMEALL